MPSREMCLQCKGRGFCGEKCIVLERFQRKQKSFDLIKGTDFNGLTPPGVFVSWKSYPNSSVSALSTPLNSDEVSLMDKEEQWFGLKSDKIVSMRQQLIGSSKKIDVNNAVNPSRELSLMQEIALSKSKVDLEIELKHKPVSNLNFNELTSPVGAFAEAKKINLTENPKTFSKAEYIVSDTDAKALDGTMELMKADLPLSFIQKIFSVGLLGQKKKRKIVPTRWSITALDSGVSEKLIQEEILFNSLIDSFQVFESKYLDNHIMILLLPFSWSFELIELWIKGGAWTLNASENQISHDFEFQRGRKEYASSTQGAYYAVRFALTQYLSKKKKQATGIVFRKIGKEYNVPLGVWVVRETAKNALNKQPLEFNELNLALKFIQNRLGEKEFNLLKSKTVVLKETGKQKKLIEFN
jgi:DNA repair protein NreA